MFRAGALVAVALLATLSLAVAQGPTPPPLQMRQDAIGVQTNQKTDSTAKRGGNPQQQVNPASNSAAVAQPNPASDLKKKTSHTSQQSGQEGNEYWPWLIFGLRLKVTDSLLAAFTFFLVAIGAWQGGHLKRTVDSFVVGERPYIFPSAPDASGLHPPPEKLRYYKTIPEKEWHVPFVTITFGNFGKTIGIIRAIRIELLLGDLPKKPTFDTSLEIPGYVIARTDKQTDPLDFGRPRPMSPQELEGIRDGTRKVHVFGYVKYTDIFGRLHEKGFCFRMHITGPHQGSEVTGGKVFNYAKSKKTPKQYQT